MSGREQQLAIALEWALDLIDMYDERLVQLGDPQEKVDSFIHRQGKAKARLALGKPNEKYCACHGYAWEEFRGMANGIRALHCAWDGSLHPDKFMELLERPGTRLTPTDKSYKVYISILSDEDPNEMRIVSTTNHHRPEGEGWLRG